MNKTFAYIVLITFLLGCKKEKLQSSYEWFSVDETIQLESVEFTNDSIGYICGGNRDVDGYVYKTNDAGKTWSKIFSTDYNRCLYTITFINDSTGYIGGDYTYFAKTTDKGNNWFVYWFKPNELSYHEKNRPDIKKIKFINDTIGYFVGGENYSKGAIYRTFDNGNSWKFDTLNNELKDIAFSSVNNGFAVGYGYISKTTDGNNFNLQNLNGDFFTGIEYLNDDSYILVTDNGGIFKYQNDQWNAIKNKNTLFKKRKSINGICSNSNFVYAVGNEGLFMKSSNYGNDWNYYQIDKSVNFTSITSTSNFIYATCTNGKLLRLKI